MCNSAFCSGFLDRSGPVSGRREVILREEGGLPKAHRGLLSSTTRREVQCSLVSVCTAGACAGCVPGMYSRRLPTQGIQGGMYPGCTYPPYPGRHIPSPTVKRVVGRPREAGPTVKRGIGRQEAGPTVKRVIGRQERSPRRGFPSSLRRQERPLRRVLLSPP